MDANSSRKSTDKSTESVSYSKTRSFPSTVWNKISGIFSNRTTAIAGVLILVLGVGAGIMAVQRSTEYRQRASAPQTPTPGTCLVLPQEFCATGKVVTNPDGTFKGIGFILPENTPIFAYDGGILSSGYINIGTNTYRGVSLSATSGTIANTYFKDTLTSGTSAVSKNVTKGEVLGYSHKDPGNPYDLIVNFTKFSNYTISIDQAMTEGNFK